MMYSYRDKNSGKDAIYWTRLRLMKNLISSLLRAKDAVTICLHVLTSFYNEKSGNHANYANYHRNELMKYDIKNKCCYVCCNPKTLPTPFINKKGIIIKLCASCMAYANLNGFIKKTNKTTFKA